MRNNDWISSAEFAWSGSSVADKIYGIEQTNKG